MDCELSMGEANGWRITRSSQPLREGTALAARRANGRLVLGGTEWGILMEEGSAFG